VARAHRAAPDCLHRFRYCTPTGARATFAEDVGPVLPRSARRTAEAAAFLLCLAEACGEEGGARLARASGLPASPDTLLRLLRQAALPVPSTLRVLGMDDCPALGQTERHLT
jgi:hypothetical protein